MKTPHLYHIIIIAWLGLMYASAVTIGGQLADAFVTSTLDGALVTVCSLFISYFWLNGTKDVIYTLYYHKNKKTLLTVPNRHLLLEQPKVVLVYCTYNDFDSQSLASSMYQDYDNYETVILDDSTDPIVKGEINAFASRFDIKVVRRVGNVGFKAGNLNNYLRSAAYDYFVILDSDEVIPANFITRALDYFAARPSAGIVQANHIASRNRNKFMATFSMGVDSHWPAYQSIKDKFGFLSLLGHGAMVSKACYEAAGGFPNVVAEDLCFSIRARIKGYFVAFAPDIICQEEYPVDYLAFKKRHSKWTQGNMEFIKRFTSEIIHAPMHWFEKLDIVLFTYSLPLTVFFFAYLVINVLLFPIVGYSLKYPLWMIAPTVLFLFAPMLNDLLVYRREKSFWTMAGYSLHCMALYGSMFFTSLRASASSLFGRSIFIVTPKADQNTTVPMALKANLPDVAFASILLAVTLYFDHSVLPTILMVITGYSALYLSFMANKPKRDLAIENTYDYNVSSNPALSVADRT